VATLFAQSKAVFNDYAPLETIASEVLAVCAESCHASLIGVRIARLLRVCSIPLEPQSISDLKNIISIETAGNLSGFPFSSC
jgi:hypothetical protein